MTTRAREVEALLRELAADEEAHPYSNAGPELTEAADTISALIAECEWRDIASAPKDGTTILGFHRNRHGDWYGLIHWEANFEEADFGSHGPCFTDGSTRSYATHWKPLVPPPQPVPVGEETGTK